MQQNIINSRTITFSCLVVLCFLIQSCNKSEEQKKYDRLRKDVLAHYKSDASPLKEKAAMFLLDNLKYRYAIEGERVKTYTDTIKRYYQSSDTLHKKLLLLRDGSYSEYKVKDIDTLTADYLIENIDRAFSALEKAGWKDQVSFNNFCEYILPYRIGNEHLENWRKEIIQDSVFTNTGDTISSFTDLRKAATWFVKGQYKSKINFNVQYGANSANIPDLPYSILNILSTGTCANLAPVGVFACRAVAIPVANDFTPHWANHTLGHDWSAIITNSGSIPFDVPVLDSLGIYRDSHIFPSKVYRYGFSENAQSHIKQRGYCEFLPDFFNNPQLIDVTDSYLRTYDISVPILFKSGENDFAYLAVSDRNNWSLVGWGTIKNGLAHFAKVGGKAVCLPVLASSSGIQPFNYPFIISEKGVECYLKPDHKNLRSVEITRKNPISPYAGEFMSRMIQSKFQAANNKDFKDAVTLYTIPKPPGTYYNEVKLNISEKYRFVRYLGRNSTRCSIAEIEFYEKNGAIPLKGKVIGTKFGPPLENAFDGDVTTIINLWNPTNNWVGLDLGKPKEISKIRFSAPNDKNDIFTGNLYELFYWENEWKSLGQKTATGKALVYDIVPSNCLLLLRNFTEGKEERIFTYENGKQVWW